MRLAVVQRGERLRNRLVLLVMRVLMRRRVPDVVRTVMYRPEFLGKALSAWTQAVMRGPSEWTVGERELFAAFTSRLNQCLF